MALIPIKDVIDIRKLYMFIVVLLLMPFLSITAYAQSEAKMSYTEILAMDTSIQIRYDANDEETKPINKFLKDLFMKYHYLSNNFQDETENFHHYQIKESIYTINNQPDQWIEINKELYDILELSKQLFDLTDGYFDIGIGKVIDLWKGVVFSKENIQKGKISKTTWNNLQSNLEKIEVFGQEAFETKVIDNIYYVKIRNGVALDLGAISKGYVTQLAANYLLDLGIDDFLITSGGSSIIIHNGEQLINVTDPTNKYKYLGYFRVEKKSVTNSGIDKQHFIYNKRKYHHIVSPISKTPENYHYSVILIGGNLGINDALSTAMLSMTHEEIEQFVKKIPETEVILIDGRRKITTYLNGTTYTKKYVGEEESSKIKWVVVGALSLLIVAGISYLGYSAYKANKRSENNE